MTKMAGYTHLDYKKNLDIMKEYTTNHGIHRKLQL
jgi:hypothetical protein